MHLGTQGTVISIQFKDKNGKEINQRIQLVNKVLREEKREN